MQAKRSSPVNYAKSWAVLRRKHRWFFFSAIAFPFCALLTNYVLTLFLGKDDAMMLTVVPAFITWFFLGFWALDFRCPRCRKTFYMKWMAGDPFTRHCLHCGLPIWAEEEEPETAHHPSRQA
jgi:hypothetical protein